MGTYTSFKFDATLKRDAPRNVLDFIKARLRRSRITQLEKVVPEVYNIEHRFFECYRWTWVLTWHNCDNNGFKAWCRDTDEGLVIHIDTRLKNYCNSIEWFFMWIAQYVNLEHACQAEIYTEGQEDWVEYESEPKDCRPVIMRILSQTSEDDETWIRSLI